MDIFGNIITSKCSTVSKDEVNQVVANLITKDNLETRFKSFVSSFNRSTNKIFKHGKTFVNFLGKRIIDVADPIDNKDVVNKQYMENRISESLKRVDIPNDSFYTKDEIEHLFSDYFTKSDLTPTFNNVHDLTKKVSNLDRKVFDKIVVVKENVIEESDILTHKFDYDVYIRKILVQIVSPGPKYAKYEDADIKKVFDISISDRIELDTSKPFSVKVDDVITLKMNKGIVVLPINVKLIMFGEITLDPIKEEIDPDEGVV